MRLADNAYTAGDAVANSTFTARVGSIGTVTIVHARGLSPTTPGTGLAIRDSVFEAVTAIGAVSITGPTQGAEFIVTGGPALRTTTTPSIASVFIRGAITTDAIFRTPTSIGPVTLWALPAGASGRVALFAPQVGDVSVGSSAATANPAIETTATSITSISAGGNLSLAAASLQTVSNVFVGGMLTLPSGLPALRTVSGAFSAGSLAPVSSDVSIGSAGTAGSVIGPIRITAANTSAGTYRFTFAGFSGTPEAIVGGTSIIALPAPGAAANGVRLIRG